MASVLRSIQKYKAVSLRLPAELADRIEALRDTVRSVPDMEFPLEELLQAQIVKLVSQCEEEIVQHVSEGGTVVGHSRGRRRAQKEGGEGAECKITSVE